MLVTAALGKWRRVELVFSSLLYAAAKRTRIEVRPAALPRPHSLASAAPCQLAADDIVRETYYYGHQSVFTGRRHRYYVLSLASICPKLHEDPTFPSSSLTSPPPFLSNPLKSS